VARDFIDRLVRLGLGINNVTSAKGSITKLYRRTRSFDHLVHTVMISKLKDAEEDLVIRKASFMKAKHLIEKYCSIVCIDVMILVRQQKSSTWSQSHRKSSDKTIGSIVQILAGKSGGNECQ
jgi:hypothetical protein